jgi:hypothetical protein
MALAIPWSQVGKKVGSIASGPSKAQSGYNTASASNQMDNSYGNALNFLSGAAGYDWKSGSSAQGRASQASLNNQLNFIGGNTDWSKGWLNKDYGVDSQLLGLDMQGNQIDRNAAQRVLNPGGLYDVQQRGLDQSRGLLARELANQMRGFDFDTSTTRRNAATNVRQVSSDATARGATNSQGLRDKNVDIYGNLVDQLGQIDVGREGARIGNERGGISLNNEQAGLTENKAQAGDRVKQLGLQSQRLGLNSTQLKNQLQKGIEGLNIQQYVDVNDIMDKLNSSRADDRQLGLQLFNQALDYGGYFPKN